MLDAWFRIIHDLERRLVCYLGRWQAVLDVDSCHGRFSPEALVQSRVMQQAASKRDDGPNCAFCSAICLVSIRTRDRPVVVRTVRLRS